MTTESLSAPREPRPELSIVIPFFNEEECVVDLLREITEVPGLRQLEYEVIAIDDGSSDRTPQLLATLASSDSHLRVLRNESNRGQAAALFRGLRAARAPVLATLDGDGQNDPADIPRLLALVPEFDMVVGIRAERRDSWLRRGMSRLANRVRGWLLKDHVRDSGCALKVFRSQVVDAFLPMRTLYSFMPALAVAGGFKIGQIAVHHRPRQGGFSSYGLHQFLILPLIDLIGVLWFIHRRFPE